MKSTTQPRSVADIRTALSVHAHSAPCHKGTPYLQILSLGMEKLRLRTELAVLAKRQGRIQARLGEILQSIDRLTDRVKEEDLAPAKAAPKQAPPRWRTVPLEY